MGTLFTLFPSDPAWGTVELDIDESGDTVTLAAASLPSLSFSPAESLTWFQPSTLTSTPPRASSPSAIVATANKPPSAGRNSNSAVEPRSYQNLMSMGPGSGGGGGGGGVTSSAVSTGVPLSLATLSAVSLRPPTTSAASAPTTTTKSRTTGVEQRAAPPAVEVSLPQLANLSDDPVVANPPAVQTSTPATNAPAGSDQSAEASNGDQEADLPPLPGVVVPEASGFVLWALLIASALGWLRLRSDITSPIAS